MLSKATSATVEHGLLPESTRCARELWRQLGCVLGATAGWRGEGREGDVGGLRDEGITGRLVDGERSPL